MLKKKQRELFPKLLKPAKPRKKKLFLKAKMKFTSSEPRAKKKFPKDARKFSDRNAACSKKKNRLTESSTIWSKEKKRSTKSLKKLMKNLKRLRLSRKVSLKCLKKFRVIQPSRQRAICFLSLRMSLFTKNPLKLWSIRNSSRKKPMIRQEILSLLQFKDLQPTRLPRLLFR